MNRRQLLVISHNTCIEWLAPTSMAQCMTNHSKTNKSKQKLIIVKIDGLPIHVPMYLFGRAGTRPLDKKNNKWNRKQLDTLIGKLSVRHWNTFWFLGFVGSPLNCGLTANAPTMLLGANRVILHNICIDSISISYSCPEVGVGPPWRESAQHPPNNKKTETRTLLTELIKQHFV